jgi:hypothetical protein
MASLTPVQAQSTQPFTNEETLKDSSESPDNLAKTRKKVEELEQRVGSLEQHLQFFTDRFDLHSHKFDPTYYTMLHGLDHQKWTTGPEFHKRDMERLLKPVSKQLSASSSSFTTTTVPLSPSRISDKIEMQLS